MKQIIIYTIISLLLLQICVAELNTEANVASPTCSNQLVSVDEKIDNNKIMLVNNLGKEIWRYSTKSDWVEDIALSKDGDNIAAVTGHYIYFFSTNSNEPLWKFCESCSETITDHPVGQVEIAKERRYIVASMANELFYFEQTSGTPVWKKQLEADITGLSISADGTRILASLGSNDAKGNKVIYFDNNGAVVWEHKATNLSNGINSPFYSPMISGDGRYISTATGKPDGRAYMLATDDGKAVFRSEPLTEGFEIYETAISEDGDYLAYATDNKAGYTNLFLFNRMGNQLWSFSSLNDTSSRAVAMRPSGDYIAMGTLTGHIYLFKKESKVPIWQFNESEGAAVGDIKINGAYVLAGTSSKKIYLFSMNNVKPIWDYDVAAYVNSIDMQRENIAVGTGVRKYLTEKTECTAPVIETNNNQTQPDVPDANVPIVEEKEKTGFFGKIWNFLKNLF